MEEEDLPSPGFCEGEPMRIAELESRTPECLDRLLEVWERSVKATHTFLSGGEVEAIKAYVPQALREVPHLVAGEDERGVLTGFLGAWASAFAGGRRRTSRAGPTRFCT